MIIGGFWVIWAGAGVWLGALALRVAVAVGYDDRLERRGMGREFALAMAQAQARLRVVEAGATVSIILGGGALAALGQGVATDQAIVVTGAGVATILSVFHVEQYAGRRTLREPHYPQQRLLFALHLAFAGAALVVAARDLAIVLRPALNAVTCGAALAAGGALAGIALASFALARPLLARPVPERAALTAVVGARWAWLTGGAALAQSIAAAALLRQVGASGPVAWLAVVGAAPLAIILALRVSLIRRLWRSVVATPIPGLAERRLRARQRQWARLAAFAFAGALVVALSAMLAVLPTLALATNGHPPAPRSIPTPIGASPTSPPTPAPSPTASGALAATNDGVQVRLAAPHYALGAALAQLTVTDAQGRALRGVTVALILSPLNASTAGVTVAAAPDPDGDPTRFAASVTFPSPGVWQIVVLVTSSDQSVAADLFFTVQVG